MQTHKSSWFQRMGFCEAKSIIKLPNDFAAVCHYFLDALKLSLRNLQLRNESASVCSFFWALQMSACDRPPYTCRETIFVLENREILFLELFPQARISTALMLDWSTDTHGIPETRVIGNVWVRLAIPSFRHCSKRTRFVQFCHSGLVVAT